MQILIVTDGSQKGGDAAAFAALLARPAGATVTLLGTGHANGQKRLTSHLEELKEALFGGSDCEVTIKVKTGYAEEMILQEVTDHFYHLVVIGWYQRRGIRRFVLGSVARYLGHRVQVPLLVVSNSHESIQRILICTSGELAGEVDAQFGGAIAALANAKVTLLHVMSQVALISDARLDDLEEDAPALIERGAREGIHLTRGLEILAEAGIPEDQRSAKVRHGLVLDEIIRESNEGNYDLIVVGAHQVPQDRAWKELRSLLQEDMCDHILTHVRRPVLIVRALDDREWSSQTVQEPEQQQG
jgi:nucleotide-binding universal stress UspA family protein